MFWASFLLKLFYIYCPCCSTIDFGLVLKALLYGIKFYILDNRWKQFAIRGFSLIMVTLCSFAVPESSAFMVLTTTILSCIICIIIPLVLTTSSNSHAHVFIIHGIIIFVITILLAGLIYGFIIRSNIAVLEFVT